MVLLFHRSAHGPKPHSKMKHHHHHQMDDSSESLSASFQSFESEVLNHLYQLSLHSKPGGSSSSEEEMYSFSWIQTCLRLLPIIDNSFAKFVVDIDFPVTEWKGFFVEEYLKDNLNLLDHLNSISSSINHMNQACMDLLYALSLVQASPKNLKAILPWSPHKNKLKQDNHHHQQQQQQGRASSEKELILHQALIVRKSVRNWICRIIDSSIRGDGAQSCLESNKLNSSSLVSLQAGVCQEMKRKGVVAEVGEINKAVIRLIAPATEGRQGDEAKELREKVEMLGKLLEGIKEDVSRLFSETFVRRNELVDSLRHKEH